jgi:hypothetical protein
MTVTIKLEMKPQTIGRALGVGLRVAGRVAGQRIAAAGQGPTASNPGAANTTVTRTAGQAAGKVARGVGGFLRPFGRIGGIIWLEVTGVFFFLFALVFGTAMYRLRPATLHGPFNRTFLASAILMLLFGYLGTSSFTRARRK